MKSLLIAAMILGTTSLIGCDNDGDNHEDNEGESISCSEAIGSFYDEDCAIRFDISVESCWVGCEFEEGYFSETDAVTACKSHMNSAKDWDCESVHMDALQCLSDTTTCDGCNEKLVEFNNCMGWHM